MTAPRIPGVLETVVYAEDLAAAERFYQGILGLEVFLRQEGRLVFFRLGAGMFLVFNPASTERDRIIVNGSPIPIHGARGPGHVAFRVPEGEVERWRRHLERAGVDIESEVRWASGGRSLYVRDPAGNSVELATAATWGIEE
jgi:catechol 2,3-dioxygenase-like lactoylglutathione lyase family enzyme